MVKIGDVYYVKVGSVSSDYDGCPVIFFRRDREYWETRYQNRGELTHDHWMLTDADIPRYLEKR